MTHYFHHKENPLSSPPNKKIISDKALLISPILPLLNGLERKEATQI
jgi:hypothetical protein